MTYDDLPIIVRSLEGHMARLKSMTADGENHPANLRIEDALSAMRFAADRLSAADYETLIPLLEPEGPDAVPFAEKRRVIEESPLLKEYAAYEVGHAMFGDEFKR